MKRWTCENCHTTNARYGAGKRVRVTCCGRLVGASCCTTIVGYDAIEAGGKVVQFPKRDRTTCVKCVPSVAAPVTV